MKNRIILFVTIKFEFSNVLKILTINLSIRFCSIHEISIYNNDLITEQITNQKLFSKLIYVKILPKSN